MIPINVPIGDMQRYNKLWEVVSAVFSGLGHYLFGQTYLGYFVVFVLLVAGAKFVWSFVRGMM